jgi:hypothetical protein
MFSVIPRPRDRIASVLVGRRRCAAVVAKVRAAILPNEKKQCAQGATENQKRADHEGCESAHVIVSGLICLRGVAH